MNKTMVVTRSIRGEAEARQFELDRAQGRIAAGGAEPAPVTNEPVPAAEAPRQQTTELTATDIRVREWREKLNTQLSTNREQLTPRDTVGDPLIIPKRGGVVFTVDDFPRKAPELYEPERRKSTSATSMSSHASSTEARRREAEREAKRKLTEIKRRELALEKQLVQEELEATIEP
jgi:hypothetical protein